MQATMRAGVLKSLLECTKEFWSSANFVFSENGMQMRAMDSSHVALVSLALAPAAFPFYRCPEQATLGIQFDALSMVLRSCAADDQIKLEFDADSDRITILRGEDRQWELKLLDSSDQDDMSIPDQIYDVSVRAPSSELQRCLRDIRDLGADTIAVTVNDHVCFSVDGHMGRGTASMKDVDIEGEMDCKCKYSLKYLSAFTKGSALCSTVRLRLGKGTPLCVAYDLEGHINLEFYLAPRIEYEDQ